MLHPRHKRFIRQIIPFSIIWLLYALIYSFIEYGILGTLPYYPSTQNQYNFPSNMIFTAVGCVVVGLIQGWIEVAWLRKRFAKRALWVKIVLKTLFYLLFIILFLMLLSTLNSFLNFHEGVWSTVLLEELNRFMGNFAFWSILIYVSVTLGIAIFFFEISEYMGEGVLYNFLFGKYHRPKKEIRVFMFLDMKSSTTIAEHMGHEKYFDLIRTYYADMTDPILETIGEIYQYVGDEIVVSWPIKTGLYRNNCVHCFYKISKVFEKKKEIYEQQFGLVPDFKAGFHIGEVTTGEIGIIKKDIIYTGDVLNTTARIQAKCNGHNAKALISRGLLAQLQQDDSFAFTELGELPLRGKKETVPLYSLEFNTT